MEPERRRWGKWEIVTASVLGGLLLLAAVTALIVNRLPSTPVTAENPVIAKFPDGGELRIYRTSVGDLTVDYPQERSWNPHTTKDSICPYIGDLQVRTDTRNGKTIRRSARMDQTNALFIEYSLISPVGIPQRLPAYLEALGRVESNTRFGTVGHVGSFDRIGDSPADLGIAMTTAGLPLLLQNHDPESGWIDMQGPYLFDTDSMTRSVGALCVWRRDLPTLDFRAVRADGAVAAFSLRNPDYRKSPVMSSPGPPPLRYRAVDYALEIQLWEPSVQIGNHPSTTVELNLQVGGRPMKGDKGDPVSLGATTAEDEWGNKAPFREMMTGSKHRQYVSLPAASRVMKLHLKICRAPDHPQNEADGAMVLEGTVTADGLTVEFLPGPAAAWFGIGNRVIGKIEPPKHGRVKIGHSDWSTMNMVVAGGGDSVALKPLERRFGDLSQWQLLATPGAGRDSAGIVTLKGRGGSKRNNEFQFQTTFDWQAPPEMLAPGATVRIGIFQPLPDDDLTFELELPAVPK